MAYKNIEDSRAATRKHYQENKQYYIDKARRRKHEIRDWLRDYKQDHGCKLCGFSKPKALDFHHRDPTHKEFNLAHASLLGYSKEKILIEIDKCDVLCSNCHRTL